jgi:pyruvate dehydrogenase E2 component (dihydrolipoamide acetyltransferase)
MPIKILMPALSPTMTEGNLVKWHKKEGDKVGIGDVLAEIETDKATMEVESIDEGTLGKIFVPEGTEGVKVNTLIAALLEEGEKADVLKNLTSEAPKAPEKKLEAAPKPTPHLHPQPQASGHIFATPLARRIAEQNNVDVSRIPGTGPKGRVIKMDVEGSLSKGPQTRSIPTRDPAEIFPPHTEVKLNTMRKVIAKRLSESKQTVPHFYLTIECKLDALLDARASLNESLAKEQKISVNDFVIKAMAAALMDVPEANASFAEDHIKIFSSVDVSVAVAIEGGLITPIIRNAEAKSLGQISSEMKDLATRARLGKLMPEEFQGGTVSLSNLGMFGIKDFAAVVNPPQGCILAVGTGEKRPIVTESGQIQVATLMNCTLSVDHRVVDGAIGATFLKAFKGYIENPILMFEWR